MKYLEAMNLAQNGAKVRRANWSPGFYVRADEGRLWFFIPFAVPVPWEARKADVETTDWSVCNG